MTTIQIKTGDTILGTYMGAKFSGVVTGLEANQSGYAADSNCIRVSIRVGADLIDPRGWTRREAGDEIILTCEKVKGGLRRDDGGMFGGLILRKA